MTDLSRLLKVKEIGLKFNCWNLDPLWKVTPIIKTPPNSKIPNLVKPYSGSIYC